MRYRAVLALHSVRNKLVLLLMLVFLPAAGILVTSDLSHRKNDIQDAANDALLMAQALATQQEQIAVGTKQMLSTLARLPELQRLDVEACNLLFHELNDLHAFYSSIAAVTPDGKVFAASASFEPGVNLADRKYIKDVIRTLDFSVGGYGVGRISKVQRLNYAYPVLDKDKNLIAIVIAGFKLDEFASFITKANLPEDAAVVITDHSGMRLYRLPENDAADPGEPLPEDVFKLMSGNSERGIYEKIAQDGILRVYGFTQVRLKENSPPYLYVSVGLAKERLLGKANLDMLQSLFFLGIAALAAMLLAWLLGNLVLVKPIGELVAAVQRLGSGELNSRTGLPHTPDEIGRLAKSFDDMASLLEQKEQEKKKAQEELIGLYRQNQLILKAAGEGIVGLDEKGTITFANPVALNTLGYEEDELIGKDLHRTIHHSFSDGTHYPATECPMRLSLKNGTSHSVRDEALWKKDGTSFPSAYSSTPIMEKDQVVGAVVTFRDITIRTRIEEDLKRAKGYLENVFENSPDAIGIVDESGRFIKWNRMAEELYGYTFEELRGMSSFDLYADKEELERMLMRLRQEGSVKQWEMLMRKGDGSVVPFEISIGILQDSENRILGSVTVARDLSEIKETLAALRASNDQLNQEIIDRKRAEEALRRSEEKFRNLFYNSGVAMFRSRLDGSETLDTNDKFLEIVGMTRAETQGTPSITFWADPKERDAMVRSLLADGRVAELEFKMLNKQGGVRNCITSLVVYRDQGIVEGTIVDITERRQAEAEHQRLEERLQRAEKMEALGTLAGGVAHDLNNVLGIIVGYSELLLDELDESNSARSEAIEIMKGGQRAAAIVQDLLTLARRGVSSRQVLNLNNIIMDCQKSPEFANIFSYHPNVRIKTDFEADLLNISGSSVHLAKSFLNLVSNAAEAMINGGRVTIKTGNQYLDKPVSGYDEIRQGDYVVLSVSDVGEGISDDNLKRIFEPFYTKKIMGRSGTGLGLSVVWGTVKDHHGYINVESEEGKGTTFTLYFPVTREDLSRAEVAVSVSEYMGSGESILVVDDVKEQRDLASAMLTKLNYRVSSVSSGEEAVGYIIRHAVDMVVLDMIMDPGMDGLDTYMRILEIRPTQRAVIVSGFAETERVIKAQELGAGVYVKKPYVLEKLGLAVRKEIDRQA